MIFNEGFGEKFTCEMLSGCAYMKLALSKISFSKGFCEVRFVPFFQWNFVIPQVLRTGKITQTALTIFNIRDAAIAVFKIMQSDVCMGKGKRMWYFTPTQLLSLSGFCVIKLRFQPISRFDRLPKARRQSLRGKLPHLFQF